VSVHDPTWSAPRPTVLIFHGMEGRSDAQVEFAERLVPLGYRGLAIDLFGTRVSRGGLERCGGSCPSQSRRGRGFHDLAAEQTWAQSLFHRPPDLPSARASAQQPL
jgi:dienelactone hydrolase